MNNPRGDERAPVPTLGRSLVCFQFYGGQWHHMSSSGWILLTNSARWILIQALSLF